MIYDVHIGKLISGRRELEGKGRYILCSTNQTIEEITSHSLPNAIFVSRKDIENELYDFCKLALSSFVEEEGRNKEVYTFSIYTDSYYGTYIIYLNNYALLNKTIDTYYAKRKERYAESGDEFYNVTREKVLDEIKYSEGDYDFIFEVPT